MCTAENSLAVYAGLPPVLRTATGWTQVARGSTVLLFDEPFAGRGLYRDDWLDGVLFFKS